MDTSLIQTEASTASPSDVLDLAWGADQIGKALGLGQRRTFHLLEKGHLPAKKIGGRWVASRAALRRHFGQEG